MESQLDRISVVIPLYNKEQYIQRAICSVLAQTNRNFELIIVNDGSTDKSLEEAQKIIDPRIRVVVQENQGVSSARNHGVRMAKSDIVAFLDADDEWFPDFLLTIARLLNAFPECGLFATNYCTSAAVGINSIELFHYPEGWQGILTNYFHDLLGGYPISSSSVAIRKRLLEQISGFPDTIHVGEDTNTWMRLALITKFAYCNKPLAIYHKDSPVVAKIYDDICKKQYYSHSDFLRQAYKSGRIPDIYKQDVLELIAKFDYPYIRHSIVVGNRRDAIRRLLLIKGIRLSRRKWAKLLVSCMLPSFVFRSLHSHNFTAFG